MAAGDSHWVRWHQPYDDPASGLFRRLGIVQARLRVALDDVRRRHRVPSRLRVLSLCAGQGRDVIDVLAAHPAAAETSALLVELDPELAAFARRRADDAGLSGAVRVVQGDAARCAWYAEDVPADVVLLCGIFGNVSRADMARTVGAMPTFCVPGGHVIWTRHRRPPDLTVAVRGEFAAAGFAELAFESPPGTVMAVGHHRFEGETQPFAPESVLFEFVGDGSCPV